MIFLWGFLSQDFFVFCEPLVSFVSLLEKTCCESTLRGIDSFEFGVSISVFFQDGSLKMAKICTLSASSFDQLQTGTVSGTCSKRFICQRSECSCWYTFWLFGRNGNSPVQTWQVLMSTYLAMITSVGSNSKYCCTVLNRMSYKLRE